MVVKTLLLVCAVFVFVLSADAQQKYIAHASGAQALPANASALYAVVEVSINPPALPGNAANLVFRGRGGTTFPTVATALLYKDGSVGQSGVLRTPIGIRPEGSWIASVDVTAEELTALRENRWYIQVNTADFPNGEVRGQFHLANGAPNDNDGDGRSDIQVYRPSNSTYYALKSSNGQYIEQQIGQPGDNFAHTVDFDGDGRSDFLTARYTPDLIWRVLPTTSGVLQETHWGTATLGDLFANGDFDGDMKTDIAVFRSGVWHILQSSDGSYHQEYWGTNGDLPGAADFDGDGTSDVSISRVQNGHRFIWTSLSSNGHTVVTQWGLSSDLPFGGRDFDGDGAADIVVSRNEGSQLVFYVRRSSDSQMQVIRWGLSTDVVRLGDYDGDGKTDAAVTRSENGQRVWYILQSSSAQVRYETFGLAGDF